MKVATELTVFVGLLRGAVVLLALGAAALFGRMSPAIEQILADNVTTLIAVEDMVSVLAQPDLNRAEATSRFSRALETAKGNLTETQERPLIAAIEDKWELALGPDGDADQRRRLLDDIRALAEVNRASMAAADSAAGRLGTAGAWAVVLLSLVILGLTQFFAGRIEARFVRPLSAMSEVVEAVESGAIHRRCAERGPPEVKRIASGLNRLLDLAASWRSAGPDRRPAGERALLGHLLDKREGEWVAVDEDDEVLFASTQAWSRLKGADKLSKDQKIYAEEVVVSDRLRLVRLDGEDKVEPLDNAEPGPETEPAEASEDQGAEPVDSGAPGATAAAQSAESGPEDAAGGDEDSEGGSRPQTDAPSDPVRPG